MKNKLLLYVTVVLILSSCAGKLGITKRRYTKGYFVSHQKGKHTTKEESTAKNNGKKYFIVISNMGTTMFGSVDNPEDYITILEKHNVAFKLHIDGAYGGFVYPFSNPNSAINFSNPKISSITIDAHKMLQAPYGTGIFICRKGLIENKSLMLYTYRQFNGDC